LPRRGASAPRPSSGSHERVAPLSLRPLRAAVETWRPGKSIAADPLHRIAGAWADVVGRNVAANSEPIALNGTTLLIATPSSAWSQQLQLLSPTILGGLAALPEAVEVTRLAFRTGLRRRVRRTAPAAVVPSVANVALENRTRAAAPASEGDTPGAADLTEAFERLRARMRAARRTNPGACPSCGAPQALDAGTVPCAPCAAESERARRIEIARLIYMTPWLGLADLREHIPDLGGAEFESARRVLLQRWWLMLERARRARKLSPSGIERHIATSYVLLQSRLAPDRITPAVVRNLLGEEIVGLVWPPEDAPQPGRSERLVE
jgi:hypothetical protein